MGTTIAITQSEMAELANLYHLAQTSVGYRRYDRLVWAAESFNHLHPDITIYQAYKLADEATRV